MGIYLISWCSFRPSTVSFIYYVWTKIPTKNLTDSALKLAGQNLSNFSLVFWSKRFFSKRHFEINWPLISAAKIQFRQLFEVATISKFPWKLYEEIRYLQYQFTRNKMDISSYFLRRPQKFFCNHQETVKIIGRFFQIFVAFSKYLNFTRYLIDLYFFIHRHRHLTTLHAKILEFLWPKPLVKINFDGAFWYEWLIFIIYFH